LHRTIASVGLIDRFGSGDQLRFPLIAHAMEGDHAIFHFTAHHIVHRAIEIEFVFLFPSETRIHNFAAHERERQIGHYPITR